jgi:hypothetical protein
MVGQPAKIRGPAIRTGAEGRGLIARAPARTPLRTPGTSAGSGRSQTGMTISASIAMARKSTLRYVIENL